MLALPHQKILTARDDVKKLIFENIEDSSMNVDYDGIDWSKMEGG